MDPLSPKTFRKLSFFVFPRFFCLLKSLVLVKNLGEKIKQFLETLGWTLCLPRLLENCFLLFFQSFSKFFFGGFLVAFGHPREKTTEYF